MTFLAQICPKRKRGFEIQKTNVKIRISILEIPCVPIFRQNGQLWVFGPICAPKWILGSEFQKSKSGFGIYTSKISCVPIFSQNRQILIFHSKFGEIAQLRAIFWFKYCWGCCRELGGGWNGQCRGWNELGGGVRSWLELRGGGWSWVEVGARFSNTCKEIEIFTNKSIIKWHIFLEDFAKLTRFYLYLFH